MAEFDPLIRTRTLARAIGPYMLVMGAVLIARLDTFALMFPAFMQDGALVLVTGAFTLIVGLAIITAHHHWSSPAAIAVSLIGAAAALKGAMLMLAPAVGASISAAIVRTPPILLIAAILVLLVGAWLTFVGWFSGKRA